jgi:hypothetical protein
MMFFEKIIVFEIIRITERHLLLHIVLLTLVYNVLTLVHNVLTLVNNVLSLVHKLLSLVHNVLLWYIMYQTFERMR